MYLEVLMLKILFRYSENDILIFSTVASVKALRSQASRTVRESLDELKQQDSNLSRSVPKSILLHNTVGI